MRPEDFELKQQIKDFGCEVEGDDESEMLLADGFEKAFIGVGRQFSNLPVAIYDYDKCIGILVDQFQEDESEVVNEDEDRDLYTEAVEYMEFNVTGSWVGERTPIFMHLFSGR